MRLTGTGESDGRVKVDLYRVSYRMRKTDKDASELVPQPRLQKKQRDHPSPCITHKGEEVGEGQWDREMEGKWSSRVL